MPDPSRPLDLAKGIEGMRCPVCDEGRMMAVLAEGATVGRGRIEYDATFECTNCSAEMTLEWEEK